MQAPRGVPPDQNLTLARGESYSDIVRKDGWGSSDQVSTKG